MHRQSLLDQLFEYASRHPEESDVIIEFTNFVKSEPRCFERSLATGHITGSAWVVNATGCEVLLTHHRKLDRWLQLGGHADGDGDVLGVAMKEAEEESGLTDFSHVGHGIFDIDIHLIPERKGEPAHFHYDVRYVLRANGCLDFTVSEESHDLRWVKLDGVKTLTSEPSMMRMVAKWSKQWVYQSRQMRLISACFFCSAAGVARSSGKTDEHGNRLCRLGELTES